MRHSFHCTGLSATLRKATSLCVNSQHSEEEDDDQAKEEEEDQQQQAVKAASKVKCIETLLQMARSLRDR